MTLHRTEKNNSIYSTSANQTTDSFDPSSSSSSLPPRIILHSSSSSRRSSFSGSADLERKGLTSQRSQPSLTSSFKSSKKKSSSSRRRSFESDLVLQPAENPLANDKRNKEFHTLFKSVPLDDSLIDDYGCALQKEILLQGRIYITQHHLCFNANIFGWVTNLVIAFADIIEIEKRTTAIFIPNAILISTHQSKHFFASFLSREQAYEQMISIWRQARQQTSSITTTINPSPGGSTDGEHQGSDDDSEDDIDDDDDLSFTQMHDAGDQRSNKMKRTRAVDDLLALSPSPRYMNENDRQTSLASLPIPTNTTEEAEAARRRAVSEAGPRPNAETLMQRAAAEELLPNITHRQKVDAIKDAAALDTASSTLPTASSPSPQQQQEHTECQCAETSDEHYPHVVMDQTYQCSLETLYNLLYHSGFVKKYLTEVERNTDVNISPWRKGDHIPYVRDVTYVKYLGGAIGPKSTKCILTEELTHVDLNHSITQQTTTQTPDVPSGSSFCVKTRLCMSWSGKGQVRVLVTVLVAFTKSSWLKSTIEKASIDGQLSYFKGLDIAIRRYIETRAPSRSKKHRHGKRKGNDKGNSHHKASHSFPFDTASTEKSQSSSLSKGSFGMLSQVARDVLQLVGDIVTLPPTMVQCTAICLILMVITNLYIALKMVNMGEQMYTIHKNNHPSSLSGSSSYYKSQRHAPTHSLSSPLDSWRREHQDDIDSMWQWLEQLEKDPWVNSFDKAPPANQQNQGKESSFFHDGAKNNNQVFTDTAYQHQHQQHRSTSPEQMNRHIIELEKMVQHAEKSVDQVHRVVKQQRQELLKQKWAS